MPARSTRLDKLSGLEVKLGFPNMHTGLHLLEVAEEYSECSIVSTFSGEDKHK